MTTGPSRDKAGIGLDPSRTRAELASTRARIAVLEEQIQEILGSSSWRLAVRLLAWQARLDRAWPLGVLLRAVRRLVRLVLEEGLAGVTTRPLRLPVGWLGRRGPHAPPSPGRPRRLPPMAMPAMAGPGGVSIVIPVFNKEGFTYACLRSVIARTPPGTYEVIVVDNASTDGTPQLLAHVDGLRVLRNPVNRGFVEACNQGAREARGEFLLFLNNDTEVLDGWLPAMVEALQSEPGTGAVGARLIYPDGRLQEAGSIIWSDGTGWNYGRGDAPDRPPYLHRREVDYCSGACLLVRRCAFEALGGFDLRYAPAYYEDTDLCFSLRERGYRVLYEPQARVVHFEGATAGTSLASGMKRFQEINRAKFAAKHAAALGHQRPPDAARVFRARDRRPGLRVLVIDHMVPRYDHDSGSVRMLGLLRLLAELGHAVTFVPDDLAAREPYTGVLRRLGVEVLAGPLAIATHLAQHARDFDLVIACRLPVASKYVPALAASPDRPRIVFDTVDLHYLREEREAAVLGEPGREREAARTRSAELALARSSDQVWVVSDDEAERLRAEDPGLSVAVVPNIHAIRATAPPFERRRDLLFIGSFAHPPNADAVQYFARAILPRVRARLPEVRLVVVGADPPPAVRALAGPAVLIAGHAPDAEPFFDDSRLLVAPLRYGAGLKGKVGQALALGLPVVTTSIGAEGMHLKDGEHALIADVPEAFADAVITLYADPALWAGLSERGRRHVDSLFGPDRVRERVAAALASVGARPLSV